MKAGKLVKSYVQSILDYCETTDKNEFNRLCDKAYSKEQFDINYAFFAVVEEISPRLNARYLSKPIYLVGTTQVRVTNDWYDRNKSKFINYLLSKGIDVPSNLEKITTDQQSVSTATRSPRRNSRYKGTTIGSAQNLLIRNILSNLGIDSFDKNKWNEVKKYFGDRCAYCNSDGKIIMDHAIPINKKSLGEHRLGNLIPSCESCNSKKLDQDYREFLKDNNKRRQRIERYMSSCEYSPLEGNEQVSRLLEMAYEDAGSLAQRYIKIINEILLDEQEPVE